MFSIQNLPYLISIISNFLLATFVLLKGKKEKVNQTFFATIMTANGWLISLFLYYNFEYPDYILYIGRINFATVLPLLYYVFSFARVFPRDITPRLEKINNFIKGWFLILIILTLFTPLIAKEEIIIGPGQRETTYGYLYPFYIITYFLFSLSVIALLFYKVKKFEKRTEKLRIKYMLVGLSISLLFGFVTNIALPYFGLFDVANYGPLATLIFAIFVATAIVRHHLFEIKVILVEFFVAIIALILFVQALMSDLPLTRILNWSVFILFCVFGYYLIKATLGEIERREEMEKISKELEKAYKELKKLDEAKTEFISIASHQLRTPLTAIKGYISLINEKIYGSPPKRMKKPLDNVYLSTERLIKLVSDLLNISRIEAGKVKLNIEKLQLEDIIDSVVDELRNLAKEKKLCLKWEKPKTPLPKTLVDTDRIRQVILNVIDNGIRYTEKGGVTVRYRKGDKISKLIVSDTGAGMTKNEISNLFRSFTRGALGQKTWTEGTGLGLYIAKKFLDLHEGKIWAKSPGKGKGSTFYIELPTE